MDGTPLLIVDAANVVGSRPDGWWRDRPGATARLRDTLLTVPSDGVPPELPPPVEVVLVVEGAARDVPSVPGVRVLAADHSGDDAMVELVEAHPQRRRLVVTADRELRERVTAQGAEVYGPRWLRDRDTRRRESH
ncbi:hypothetical protein [Micromonospora endolithica]|uniref:NTP pyrophosphohydrolase n=1 Tax=Micromonospora endolithica TaxID=230091 RepID=A0A3A9ZK13_9ACTN|nr:hypothetical protein [Micromonospora endolithica]RKN48643.1 hypothetical protein D7223_11760 [Micromonospora endolithica]TWJ22021.1 hypothetical protein JD76_02135 [Micromonospora endolithica]